jgi:hypothetical protein
MTPWIDTSKIRVGPISPEERRAIDAQLARLIAQHRFVTGEKQRTGRPFVFGAVTEPKRKGKCSPEHAERLRAYNAARAAARARKEADNVADQVEVRFLEARAA